MIRNAFPTTMPGSKLVYVSEIEDNIGIFPHPPILVLKKVEPYLNELLDKLAYAPSTPGFLCLEATYSRDPGRLLQFSPHPWLESRELSPGGWFFGGIQDWQRGGQLESIVKTAIEQFQLIVFHESSGDLERAKLVTTLTKSGYAVKELPRIT